jgi:hypothetical protein
MMKQRILIFLAFFVYPTVTLAADDHSGMMQHGQKNETSTVILTEAGNDAFGTIQEVVMK